MGDIANSLQPLCYCPERDLVLGKKAYVCQVCSLYLQTNQKVSDVYEESRKGAEKKIKEKKIELEAFEIAELKGENDIDLTSDEFEEEEEEEVPLKFEKRKLAKDELEDSEEFTEVECPFCGELFDDLRSHLQICEFAPDDASIDDMMPKRKKKKKSAPTSKKDSKGAQVCPYCGKEFVRLGRHLSSCPKKPKDEEDEEEEEDEDEEEDEEDEEEDEDEDEDFDEDDD
ncbi:MAG: hypothetical protein ACFE9R_10965 [Candidatus Hermodarchaeota archaeon]